MKKIFIAIALLILVGLVFNSNEDSGLAEKNSAPVE